MNYLLKRFGLAASVIFVLAGHSSAQPGIKEGTKYCVERFGQREFAVLMAGLPNDKKKILAEDPDLQRSQTESLRKLLAFGCEAEKRGLANDAANRDELDNIRTETIAVNYDRKMNKAPSSLPFSWISGAQIAEFYKNPRNSDDFEKFLASKVAQLGRTDPQMADRQISDDEKQEARVYFAKIKIAEAESTKAAAKLTKDEAFASELQVMLQQVQFLARALSDQIAPEISVSDREVADYIRSNPEFNTSAKKAEAEKLLVRAKAGEDFAALADQYSEDPGNTSADGKKNGGLYKDVSKGSMVAPFENAALSVEPGAIYPDVVESDFGYHLIKLEKKTVSGDTIKYDVRHILISTMFKDPNDPSAREVPMKDYVRGKLESDKESGITAKIVADNSVEITGFVVNSPAAKKTIARPAARKKAPMRPPARRH